MLVRMLGLGSGGSCQTNSLVPFGIPQAPFDLLLKFLLALVEHDLLAGFKKFFDDGAILHDLITATSCDLERSAINRVGFP